MQRLKNNIYKHTIPLTKKWHNHITLGWLLNYLLLILCCVPQMRPSDMLLSWHDMHNNMLSWHDITHTISWHDIIYTDIITPFGNKVAPVLLQNSARQPQGRLIGSSDSTSFPFISQPLLTLLLSIHQPSPQARKAIIHFLLKSFNQFINSQSPFMLTIRHLKTFHHR